MIYYNYESPLTNEEFFAKYPEGTKLSEIEPLDLTFSRLKSKVGDSERLYIEQDVDFHFEVLDNRYNDEEIENFPGEHNLYYFARGIPGKLNRFELFIFVDLKTNGEYLLTKRLEFDLVIRERKYPTRHLSAYVESRLRGNFLRFDWRHLRKKEEWGKYCSDIEMLFNFKESDKIPVELPDVKLSFSKQITQSEKKKNVFFSIPDPTISLEYVFENMREGKFDNEQVVALAKFIRCVDSTLDVHTEDRLLPSNMVATYSGDKLIIVFNNDSMFQEAKFISSLPFIETQDTFNVLFGPISKYGLELDMKEHLFVDLEDYVTTTESQSFRKIFLESSIINDVSDFASPVYLLIQGLMQGYVGASYLQLESDIRLNESGEIVFKSKDFLRGLRILLGAFPEIDIRFSLFLISDLSTIRMRLVNKDGETEIKIPKTKYIRNFVVDRIEKYIEQKYTNG